MTKYLINRILRGLLSVVAVVAIVMLLIYSLMNRDQIFAQDSVYSHMKSNAKEVYKMQQWEKYGYLDYVPYADYLKMLLQNGDIKLYGGTIMSNGYDEFYDHYGVRPAMYLTMK